MVVSRISSFLFKRLHSLFGLTLTLFLVEHLWTNAQSVTTINGKGFVQAVNWLHSLPFLGVIEILTLLIPFLIHIIWGILYTRKAKVNLLSKNLEKPTLRSFGKNWAFFLQRFSAILLIVGVAWHVYDMRFARYPIQQGEKYYVHVDAEFPSENIENVAGHQMQEQALHGVVETAWGASTWEKEKSSLSDSIIATNSFGQAVLLNVQDSLRNQGVAILYTLFVLLTVFHAFNGLWTFCFSWGVIETEKTANRVRALTIVLMILVGILGLIAVWGQK